MSKIIFLNGCGSSGKSSIARSIQQLSDEHWLTFGIDTFISMTPYPSEDKGCAGYFKFIPGKNKNGSTMRVEPGPRNKQLFGVMPIWAALLADNNNNVIIDEVLLENDRIKEYLQALQNHTVYFVGVTCELEVLQEREFLRRNRAIGLSNDQFNRVHSGIREYDLMVDTTLRNNFSIAREILKYTDETPSPSGFINMRAMFN